MHSLVERKLANPRMRILSYFITFSLILFTTAIAYADQLIIEPDMGREPIINAIKNARQSIGLVMYGLTDEQILNALIQRKLNGMTVKVLLEEHPYKNESENTKTIAKLMSNHIDWQGSIPLIRLIHQKTLLIDGSKAIVMTFNFTHSSFKNERNFGLILEDPKQVKPIQDVFSADWNRIPIDYHSTDVIYSPGSRGKILDLISRAKDGIKLYTQTITDYKITGALARAARKGVKVQIITSAKISEGKANYLQRAGITVHHSNNLYIHANAFIIDNQLALVGSINLSRSSLEDNRELSAITYDKNVIKQLTTTFDKDWNTTESNTHLKQNIYHSIHIMRKLISPLLYH